MAQLDSASDSDSEGERVKTVINRFGEAKSPKQGVGRAERTEAIGDDYATGRDEGSSCCFYYYFLFSIFNFYPWHSWIARQTPTLKVEGSNPFG